MLNKAMRFGMIFWSAIGWANTNDDIGRYRSQAKDQSSSISSTKIDGLKINSSQAQLAHKTLIDSIMHLAAKGLQSNQKPQEAPSAMLFVSFSMPDSLLLTLADEAALFDIPVVINGLVDGDFKKTIEAFKRLHLMANKQHLNFKGVFIDPLWFTQFQIKSVPALVVTEPLKNCASSHDCETPPFDVVYGNARLKKALELIASKGDAAPHRAQAILESKHV
ncbi:MAG: type-F conjugative transfer system pilin assembly protein TrbC [Legionella sp.]|nr:type-F conjugative transfer system pilin assembly protein TrbC [Legionella sp.]